MGNGSSRDLGYGVPINPRVDYAHTRSRKENKIVRIDAPALVHLKHGTLRYRFDKTADKSSRREIPHEYSTSNGQDSLKQRQDYFFHPKHTHLSADNKSNPGDSWKYCQVYKGPERAKQKKLYYVFGKGLKVNSNNGLLEHNYKPEEQTFRRPIFYKTHGHVYLDMILLKDGEMTDDDDEEEKSPLDPCEDKDPLNPDDLQDMETKMDANTTILDIKEKMARKLVKPISHIHIYMKGNEIRADQKLQDFRNADKSTAKIKVLLHPK